MRKGRTPQSLVVSEGDNKDGMFEPCLCKSGQTVTCVCRRCQKLICQSCKTAKHKYHDTGEIAVVARELKGEVQTKASARSKDGTPTSQRQRIDDIIEELFMLEMNEIDKITDHLKSVHEEVDKIGKALTNRVNEVVMKETQYLRNIQMEMERNDKCLTSLCDEANELVEDIDIVKKGYHLIASLNAALETELKLPSIPSKETTLGAKFVPGEVIEGVLGTMCGVVCVEPETVEGSTVGGETSRSNQVDPVCVEPEVDGSTVGGDTRSDQVDPSVQENMGAVGGDALGLIPARKKKPKLLVTFNLSNTEGVYDLCALGELCWVRLQDTDDIRLVNMCGDIQETVHVADCNELTASDNGTVYMSCGKSVHVMSPDGTMSQPYKTLWGKTDGLALDPTTNNVLVCSGGNVVSLKGRRLKRILDDGKIRNANDIAVNSKGDICVCDYDSEKVVLYDSGHNYVATYKMDPAAVSCNNEGNFVVIDQVKKKLHVINRYGKNVLVYNIKKDCQENPWICSVSVSPLGHMWVGFGEGQVCVYDMV
ncbi:hypothetical protein ScPMuIL_017090 [Solemya velum]